MKKIATLVLLSSFVHFGFAQTPNVDWTTTKNTTVTNPNSDVPSTGIINHITQDGSGNVYVAGAMIGAATNGSGVLTVIKYNSSGVQQWVGSYQGNSTNIAYDIAVDGSGNVYVCGSGQTSASTGVDSDMLLVKFNSAGGFQWASSYSGNANDNDVALELEISSTGNIYLGGWVTNTRVFTTSTNGDMAVVKFNSSGVFQWAQTFDGAHNATSATDRGLGVGLDASENVYIAGSVTNTNSIDLVVKKYNSSGVEQASVTYDHTVNSSDDCIHFVVDNSGNVFAAIPTSATFLETTVVKFNSSLVKQWHASVSGTESLSFRKLKINGSFIYAAGAKTISTVNNAMLSKIDMSTGAVSWTSTYANGFNQINEFSNVAVDASDNIYCTGDDRDASNTRNFSVVKFNSAGTFQWAKTYSGTNASSQDYSTSLVTDGTKVYVGGRTDNLTTNKDLSAWAINCSDGTQQWLQEYNPSYSGVDKANSVAFDASGNVYAAGPINNTDPNLDIASIKYNSSGVQQWSQTLNGTNTSNNNNDLANVIKVDASGNVYTVGYMSNLTTGRDYVTVKYNSAGTQQWLATEVGNTSNNDEARDVAIDASGNVYVAGRWQASPGAGNVYTVKYNSAGTQQWVGNFNGTGNTTDEGNAIALGIGATPNVYTAGYTTELTNNEQNGILIKYNNSGAQQWTANIAGTATGTGTHDRALAMTIDASENTYVTGYRCNASGSTDMFTAMYNNAGTQQWITDYNGTGTNSLDQGLSVAVDASGNVYTAGYAVNASGEDFILVKYNSTGVQQWVKTFNGTGNTNDRAVKVRVDASGNVYATGYLNNTSTGRDAYTVKYNSAGTLIWSYTYNGNASMNDEGSDLQTDGTKVYLTGYTTITGNSADIFVTRLSDATPEINVQGNSITIIDGDVTPTITDNSDFGSQIVCVGTLDKVYNIQNTGTATLSITGVSITGTNAADFTVTAPPASSVAAGGSTLFRVSFNPSALGVRTATINIANNDADEATYDFAIQGTGVDPEINVQGNSTSIVSGDATPSVADHTDFGTMSICAGTIVRTFTIQNSGTASLSVTGVSISGTNAADFTVTTAPATNVGVSGSTTFQVTFNPSASGVRVATITVANGDCDESSYTFAIQGNGSDPSLSIASQTNVSTTGGSDGAASVTASGGTGGYTYNWTPGNPTGDGTASVTGLTAGSWTCTVTDGSGCSAQQIFTITEPSSAATALNFDGTNDYVEVVYAQVTTNITHEMWFKTTNPNCGLMEIGDGVLGSNGWDRDLYLSGGNVVAYLWLGGPTENISSSGTNYADGAWHHVAYVIGGAQGAQKLYVDGILKATGTASASSFNWNTKVTIGYANPAVSKYFSGNIDEVRIWNRALCQAEIQNNMNCQIATSATGLAGNYHFNQGFVNSNNTAVTTLTDASGNARTGTLNGFTLTGLTSNWSGPGAVSTTCAAFVPTSVTVTSASQTNVSCNGGTNGAASVNASGGSGLTYDWTPGTPSGDGTASVTGLTAGSWTCTVTNNCGGTGSFTFNISQPTALSLTPGVPTNVSCNGGSNGAASVTASGGSGGNTYNWTPGNPTGDGTVSVTGLTAGTWTCTVTDANTCTAQTTVTVSQPTALILTPGVPTNVSCNGGSNGAASVSASGGSGSNTYNWTPGNPTGDGTVSVTGLTSGTWTCTVTDANTCTAQTTVTVSQPTALSASSNATSILCNGGNAVVTVSASGGTSSYTGTGSYTVTAGSYTYTVTDANSCSTTTSITVSEPAAITGSQTLTLCAGQSVTVGTNTYTSTGVYTDVLPAANGCDSTVTTNLTVNPAITGSQTLTLCAGQSVTVGTNTYTSTGVYTDVLTAANGCDSTVTTNLTVNPAITGSQTLTLCAGQSVTVGTNTYNATGVYTDVFTAANGCDSTVTTNLTVNAAITGSQTLTLCAGQSVTVGTNTYTSTGVYTDVLTAAGGCDSTVTTNLTVENAIDVTTSTAAETITANQAGASYQWIDCDNGNQAIAGETGQSFTATANGNYAVVVTVNACSDTSACANISSIGIKDVKQAQALNVYPNPSTSVFNITGLGNDIILNIYNTLGELVLSTKSDKSNVEINLTEQPNGVYVVKTSNNQIIKLLKQQ